MARDRPLAHIVAAVVQRLRLHGGDVEAGQGIAEYALILSLIAIVAISVLVTLGQPIQNMLSSLGQSI